jgi:ribosomal protein L11
VNLTKEVKNLSREKEKVRVVVRALITGGAASGGPPIGPAVGPTGIKG